MARAGAEARRYIPVDRAHLPTYSAATACTYTAIIRAEDLSRTVVGLLLALGGAAFAWMIVLSRRKGHQLSREGLRPFGWQRRIAWSDVTAVTTKHRWVWRGRVRVTRRRGFPRSVWLQGTDYLDWRDVHAAWERWRDEPAALEGVEQTG